MAKDPATLWYWNDWQGGTATYTRHLKGCFMDLLHAQFNSGRLSLAQIKIVLGVDFGQCWPILQEKFIKDDNDKYYNRKAEEVKEKRQKYTESRRNNLKKPHMDSHMKPHMEIENENVKVLEKEGVEGKTFWEKEENKLFPLPHCMEIALKDEKWVSKNRTSKRELELFNDFLEKTGESEKTLKDYKKHFGNKKLKNPELFKVNGSSLQKTIEAINAGR